MPKLIKTAPAGKFELLPLVYLILTAVLAALLLIDSRYNFALTSVLFAIAVFGPVVLLASLLIDAVIYGLCRALDRPLPKHLVINTVIIAGLLFAYGFYFFNKLVP